MQNKIATGQWWCLPFIPALGRWISVSSRPAWSTELVPGQLGLLHRETLSQKNQNQIIIIIIDKEVLVWACGSSFYGDKKVIWAQEIETSLIYFLPSFFLFIFFLSCIFFWDRFSLCSSGCPGTHSVDQADLRLRDSQLLGLKMCTTMTDLFSFLEKGYLYYFQLCVYMCVGMCVSAGTPGGQRHWVSLEMELQVIVDHLQWVLGTGFWSSVRTIHSGSWSHLSSPSKYL